MARTIEMHSPVDSEPLRLAKPNVRGRFACRYRARYAAAQQIAAGRGMHFGPPERTSAGSPSGAASKALRIISVESDRMRLAHVALPQDKFA